MVTELLSVSDVIFFIYLYQKYIYPTDHKRVNEFGTTGDMDTEVSDQAANNGQAILTADQEQTAAKPQQEKKDD